jgi:hypothetical protein
MTTTPTTLTTPGRAGNPPCLTCGERKPGDYARGNCSTCYNRHRDNGTLDDCPRKYRTRDGVVEDYLFLREHGYADQDRQTIAAMMGIKPDTLCTALRRAADAGDDRIDYRPRPAARRRVSAAR